MTNAKLFRHIQLKIGKLELGERLPASVIEATGATPGVAAIELPAVAFGKAQTIALHLTPDGRLRSASFEYKPDADLEKMIGDYVSLGEPMRESLTRGAATIETARWADAETELTLTRQVSAGGSRIRGELTDRKPASG
jgi:hypothetical protein